MEYHEVVREGRDEATGYAYRIKAVVISDTRTSQNPEHGFSVYYTQRQVDGAREYDLQLSGGISASERRPFARGLEIAGVPLAACAQTAALIFDEIYPVGRMSRLLDDDELYLDTYAFVEIVVETRRREALEKVRVGPEATGCCVVCMDEISAGSEVIKMPCAHLFHGECILTWLHNSSSCPLCRYTLPSAVDH